MSVGTISAPLPPVLAPALPWAHLRAALPALALGLGVIGALFWREMVAAVEVWDASTAYNHCFLVLPIALWMAWERRASLAHVPVRPDVRAVLLGVPFVLAWLVAERIGIMEGRQLAVIGLVEVLFLTVLGWPLFRLLSAPLLYLIFLVPFGAFLTPWLQDVTAWFTITGLNVLGILHYTDGLVIHLSAGTFYIAEACAGLRFLIASIAFGALYACTIYRSPARRAVFIAISIVVPIIANGFRALGIVVAGHYLGSAEAAAADHVIYGWVFFSFVTLLLILIGLPFRQDGIADRAPPVSVSVAPPALAASVPLGGVAWRAGLAVSLLVVLGPALTSGLEWVTQPDATARAAPLIASWTPGGDCVPATAIARRRPITAPLREWRCAGGQLRVTAVVFPANVNPGQIVVTQRTLSGEEGADETDVTFLAAEQPGEPRWRVMETRKPGGIAATALWLEGRPGAFGLRARVTQARASLTGGQYAPVLLAITPILGAPMSGAGEMDASQRAQARLGLGAFLQARRGALAQIADLSAIPAR